MSVQTFFQTVSIYRTRQSEMLKQTFQLFLKALIIGILINIGLQYAAIDSKTNENVSSQHEDQEQRHSLEQLPLETIPNLSAPTSD